MDQVRLEGAFVQEDQHPNQPLCEASATRLDAPNLQVVSIQRGCP